MHYMTSYLDSPRMQSVPLPESIRQDKSKGKLKGKDKALNPSNFFYSASY